MNFKKLLHWSGRKRWYLNKECSKSFCIEMAGWDSTPAIAFEIDPSDREYTIHLAFGIGIWIIFSRIFPKSWYPEGYDEKEIAIRFHNRALWWSFWMSVGSWNSKEPWYRRDNINFENLVKGKHSCKWDVITTEHHVISFFEGNYGVKIEQKLRIDSWKRWFTKKSISYEATPGIVIGDEFKGTPVPVEGKGENSWDCDEDATYSMSFSGGNTVRTCYEAALYFENSMKKSRARYGSPRWMPKAYRRKGTLQDINLIQPIVKPAAAESAPAQTEGTDQAACTSK